MNWLGKKIQRHVGKNDTVLDIGCGIMQATTDFIGTPGNEGNIKCKNIVGVDIDERYLNIVKQRYATIRLDVTQTSVFVDKSYDVVLCTDLLEHLEKDAAMKLLREMERIARKAVIAYTPKHFHSNEEHVAHAWGMDDNPHQAHKCLVSQDEFKAQGYDVETTEIDGNTFAVKKIA